MIKGLLLKKTTKEIVYKKYEKVYQEYIQGAFVCDKHSYRRLLDAIRLSDKMQYNKVHEILDKLLEKCTCTRDFWVVYEIKAIAYAKEGRDTPLIEVYEKMLRYDMTHSRVWSNLGLAYLRVGKSEESRNAFMKSIEYDSENPLAYNNMAVYYIKTVNPDMALEYALKTIEMNPDLYQPYSAAAISSKMLGNMEAAEYYMNLYMEKGGQKEKAKKIMTFE